MAARLSLNPNGKPVQTGVDPQTPLLYVLRNELDQHGPRFGCGLAQCGACTVHVNGQAMRSCVLSVAAAAGREVTTLDGLAAAYRRQTGRRLRRVPFTPERLLAALGQPAPQA